MVVAAASQPGIAAPVIGDDQRPRRDRALYEAAKGIGAPVSGKGQSNPSGITPIPSALLRGARFPVPDLDGGDHQRLVMDTPAFAAGSATDPGFVDLDVLASEPADPVLIRTHHSGAQLVKQTKSRFIST